MRSFFYYRGHNCWNYDDCCSNYPNYVIVAGAPRRTPLGELMTLPQILWSSGEGTPLSIPDHTRRLRRLDRRAPPDTNSRRRHWSPPLFKAKLLLWIWHTTRSKCLETLNQRSLLISGVYVVFDEDEERDVTAAAAAAAAGRACPVIRGNCVMLLVHRLRSTNVWWDLRRPSLRQSNKQNRRCVWDLLYTYSRCIILVETNIAVTNVRKKIFKKVKSHFMGEHEKICTFGRFKMSQKIPNRYPSDAILKLKMHWNSFSVVAVPWTLPEQITTF